MNVEMTKNVPQSEVSEGPQVVVASQESFGLVEAKYWMETDRGFIGNHYLTLEPEDGPAEDVKRAREWGSDMQEMICCIKGLQAWVRLERALLGALEGETAGATSVATAQVGAVD